MLAGKDPSQRHPSRKGERDRPGATVQRTVERLRGRETLRGVLRRKAVEVLSVRPRLMPEGLYKFARCGGRENRAQGIKASIEIALAQRRRDGAAHEQDAAGIADAAP